MFDIRLNILYYVLKLYVKFYLCLWIKFIYVYKRHKFCLSLHQIEPFLLIK